MRAKCVRYRFLEHHQRARVFAQRLSRRRRVAGLEGVDGAKLHRVHAQRVGNPVHVDFDRELRLRCAESAKRAVWRSVRKHGSAANANVLAAIRTRAWMIRATERRGSACIRAAVQEYVDVHRDEPTVLVTPVR